MFNFIGRTKIMDSKELPIQPGYQVTAEGLALVSALDNGFEYVYPCQGVVGERFVGFSYSYTLTPTVLTTVEYYNVPATPPYTINLSYIPVAANGSIPAQIYVNNGTVGLTIGDPSTVATAYSIAGTSLTFNAAQAGLLMSITYKYNPTSLDLMFNNQAMYTSFTPSAITGTTGVILRGEVFTDQFDASAGWTQSSPVMLGANGMLTDTGSGTVLDCVLTHIPTADIPYIGVRFV